MGYALLKKKAHSLFEQAPFIFHIHNESDYAEALKLMEELIDDYDYNKPLIDILSISIERWETTSDEFAEFNARINEMDSGVATLKLLMSQFNLGTADFPEIGSKSLVSKILNHKRKLTADHIRALSKRFKISPSLFFSP